jgi:hydrogenase maturation protease
MPQPQIRCLILACGNTLRSDDGIGPWLAEWAEERFAGNAAVCVLARQQWTPDLAEDIAHCAFVLFVDCSVDSAPGSVNIVEIQPRQQAQGLATHRQGAPELLFLARELFHAGPRPAKLLTVGAGSTELGETFSEAVLDAVPKACEILETTILQFLHQQEK